MLTSYLSGPSITRSVNHLGVKPAEPGVDSDPVEEDILDTALNLLDQGQAVHADELLTAALFDSPFDERLWLAAGISRLRRGSLRAAASAFEMSAWLSDDQSARELLHICQGITV